jgi:hypothetical protein
MSVNHGGTGEESPELAVGDANTSCPPNFCNISKFQALAIDSSPRFQPRLTPLGS